MGKGKKGGKRMNKRQVTEALMSLFQSKPNETFTYKDIFKTLGLDTHPLKMLAVQALEEMDLACEVTAVGDRYVLENMRANGHKLGGEQSGHIIFSDYSTTGDGLITALQVLTAMKKFNTTASELNALMTTYPQVLINVRVKNKNICEESEAVKLAIAEGEFELGNTGRILVRASGTEPLIRIMAEGRDKHQLNRICNKIAAEVEKGN